MDISASHTLNAERAKLKSRAASPGHSLAADSSKPTSQQYNSKTYFHMSTHFYRPRIPGSARRQCDDHKCQTLQFQGSAVPCPSKPQTGHTGLSIMYYTHQQFQKSHEPHTGFSRGVYRPNLYQRQQFSLIICKSVSMITIHSPKLRWF